MKKNIEGIMIEIFGKVIVVASRESLAHEVLHAIGSLYGRGPDQIDPYIVDEFVVDLYKRFEELL